VTGCCTVSISRVALPNFFIIGAAKSGTTALYRYLQQHPEVYLPTVKEPRFFAYDPGDRTAYAGPNANRLIDGIIRDQARYEALYSAVTFEKAIGDVSPAYMPSAIAARRISEAVPHARIVAILRNPVDRAYSHFIDNVQSGWEPVHDFERVLELRQQREEERWWRKWDYVGNGFYGEQLGRYFAVFPRDRIRVYLYEDLERGPRQLMRDLHGFLGVDPSEEPDVSTRHNVSGLPRSASVHAVLTGGGRLREWLKRLVPAPARRAVRTRLERGNLHKPEMPDRVRTLLKETYREDIERLSDLIQRDLSSWR
jgi:hypothetical protein